MTELATKITSASGSQGAVDFATFTVAGWCTRIVVEVAVSAAAKCFIKFAGGTLLALNNNSQLTADTLYAFTISVDPGEAIAFQLESTVTVRRFMVDGFPGGI